MPLAFLARRALAALAVLLAAPAVLAQTGTVVGTVTDTDGEPLAAATVRIDNTTLGDATDVDGMFRVAGVPAGSQTVVITLLGYTRVEREVTVPAGGDVRVDATLADDALRLSEVAVTATRRTEDISDVPRAVAVATEETVDRYAEQTSDFSATLGKFIPNFTSPSVGNDVFTATLRGRKPLYLLDGVPLQTNEGVRGATLSNIEPSVLDRIEVLYGASTVYGGGAPGGVIQFFTREASEEPLDVQVQGFTRNYLLEDRILDGDALDFRTSATVSGTLDRFRYLVNGALETANGTFRADGQRIGNVGTNDYDEYALFGKFSYDLTPSQTVRVTVNRDYRQPNNLFFTNEVRDEDRLADPVFFTSVSVPVETAFSYDTPISQTYTSGNVQYQNRSLGGGALSLQGYYFDTNFQQGGSDIRALIAANPPFASWPGIWQTSSDAQQLGARAEYVRPITGQVLVTVGGDVLSASDATPVTVSTEGPFDAENRFDGAGGVQDQGAPTDLVSGGAFVQADFEATETLRFTAGARYDYIAFDVLPFIPTFTTVAPGVERPGGSGTNDGFSLNVGSAFEFVPDQTVYANFSQGFSLPELAFLFTDVAPDQEISGDAIVQPQIVNNVDLGIRGRLGAGFAYGLAGFYAFSETGSQIAFDNESGLGERVQAPRRNYGFEATVEASPADGLRVGADLALTEIDADPDDVGEFRPGSSNDAIPLTTSLRGEYELPAVDGLTLDAEFFSVTTRDRAFRTLLNADGTVYDAETDGDPDLTEEGEPLRADGYIFRGFSTIDLGIRYALPAAALGGVEGSLAVRVQNVLNESYVPANAQRLFNNAFFANRRSEGLGRNVTVSLSLDF